MKIDVQRVWACIYQNDGYKLPDGYVVAYGNLEVGTKYETKEELIKNWRNDLYMGWHQDLYLYHNGIWIRTVRNYHSKVTGTMKNMNGLNPASFVKTEYLKYGKL